MAVQGIARRERGTSNTVGGSAVGENDGLLALRPLTPGSGSAATAAADPCAQPHCRLGRGENAASGEVPLEASECGALVHRERGGGLVREGGG
jgi:hypothetical protein